MSDAFNIAARIPMSRAGFERWLGRKVNPPSNIDFSTMYRGWYWQDVEVVKAGTKPEAKTVKHALTARLQDLETTLTMVSHEEAHLLLYDMTMVGPDHLRFQCSVALLAEVRQELGADAKGYALYWADISGRLPGRGRPFADGVHVQRNAVSHTD